MAAIDSPRCILGERDVNKPLFTKPPSTGSSPSKLASFSHNNALCENTLDVGKFSQVLLSPKIHEASPSGGRKRGAECLENVQDGPPRKQAVIDLPQDSYYGTPPRTGDEESHHIQNRGYNHRVSAAATRIASALGLLRCSVSPDSSFDATQDSDLLDSQITNITEPEDLAPLPPPAFTIASLGAPRIVSQDEARENAEALRLRLKVAMYKVKTNQTDLPLSRLQIRSTRANNSTRALLPASRLDPTSHHSKPMTTASHPSQDIAIDAEDYTSIPSSSPPTFMSPDRLASHVYNPRGIDFATPILPRSRNGYSLLNSRGSPEPGPEVTSSIVKGRAADGLLSLMGGEPRRP